MCTCMLSVKLKANFFPLGSKGTSEGNLSTSHEYLFFPGTHTVERTSGEEEEKESPRKRIFKRPRSKRTERGSSRSCTVDYSNWIYSLQVT